MEETIKAMKQYFRKKDFNGKDREHNKNCKLAFAIGYLKENDYVTRKQAIEIIEMIFHEEI